METNVGIFEIKKWQSVCACRGCLQSKFRTECNNREIFCGQRKFPKQSLQMRKFFGTKDPFLTRKQCLNNNDILGSADCLKKASKRNLLIPQKYSLNIFQTSFFTKHLCCLEIIFTSNGCFTKRDIISIKSFPFSIPRTETT